MVTRLRRRRGAIWTALGIGVGLGIAAAYPLAGFSAGLLLPGMALLALGLVLVGAPASRASRGLAGEGVPARGSRSLDVENLATAARIAARRRTIIVGTGDVAQSLARELERSETHEVIGFVDEGALAGSENSGLRVLGSREELLDLVDRFGVEEVVIAEAPTWQQRLVESAMSRGRPRFEVKLVPGLYETAIGRLPLQRVKDIPLLAMAPWQRSRNYERIRRAFDVLFSVAALVVTAPLMALAALAIKIGSPGPVLFRQDRVGLDGETFVMLKLRTMILDAERDGPSLCSGYDDRRLTPVGRVLRKTRMDEIPQFVNVLRGEMSVIGPRPERPCFVERFERQIAGYHERHRIRPGITGLAQVNGHYLTSARDKLRYDLFYLYHRCLWLDVRILLRTFAAMIH